MKCKLFESFVESTTNFAKLGVVSRFRELCLNSNSLSRPKPKTVLSPVSYRSSRHRCQWKRLLFKACFPCDRPDRPWDDWSFPYDRLDRFKNWRRAVVSDVPGSDNRILARYPQTKWRTSIGERSSWLVIFLFFFLFCAVEEHEESHEDIDFVFDRYIRSEKN